MHIATTYLRSQPDHADDLSTWLAWALPRGIDAALAEPNAVATFRTETGAGRGWVRSWRRTCRERLSAPAQNAA